MTVELIGLRKGDVQRIAPCGAPLKTGRKRPLAGLPLYRRIEAQLRTDTLAAWHLPLADYDCTVERDDPGAVSVGVFIARSEESLTATFTHRETRARILVTGIWVDDDGQIVQWGTQYGDLTL